MHKVFPQAGQLVQQSWKMVYKKTTFCSVDCVRSGTASMAESITLRGRANFTLFIKKRNAFFFLKVESNHGIRSWTIVITRLSVTDKEKENISTVAIWGKTSPGVKGTTMTVEAGGGQAEPTVPAASPLLSANAFGDAPSVCFAKNRRTLETCFFFQGSLILFISRSEYLWEQSALRALPGCSSGFRAFLRAADLSPTFLLVSSHCQLVRWWNLFVDCFFPLDFFTKHFHCSLCDIMANLLDFWNSIIMNIIYAYI